MNYTSTVAAPKIKPLWRIDKTGMDLEEGGFTLETSNLNLAKQFAAKGVLLSLSYITRIATIQKTANVIAGSTVTKTRISKHNLFKVGDIVGKTGAQSKAITAIDISNAVYDELTHATLGVALVENDILIEAASESATCATKHIVDALLNDTTKLVGTPTITAKVTGFPSVKEGNLIYPISAAIKTAMKFFRFV